MLPASAPAIPVAAKRPYLRPRPAVTVAVLLSVSLVAVWIAGCSRNSGFTKADRSKVIQWVELSPAFVDPSPYRSLDEWGQVGQRLPHVGEILVSLYRGDPNLMGSHTRGKILRAVGYAKCQDCVSFLITVASEPNYPENSIALDCLAMLKSKEAVDPLCRLGRSTRDWRIKMGVLNTLAAIGDPNSLPAAEQLAEDLKSVTLPEWPQYPPGTVTSGQSSRALTQLRAATQRAAQ